MSKHQAIQITLVPPLGQQLAERVKARSVGLTEVEPDAFASAAAFVVVIAWRASRIELAHVNRGLADGFAPLVLCILTGLDRLRSAGRGLRDDIGDVLALQVIVGGKVRGDADLGEPGVELVGESTACQ